MKKVLLIENFGADFYKARIPLAKFLIEQGHDVYALVPNDEYLPLIKTQGIKTISYSLDRENKGLFQILKLAYIYRSIIKKYNFDIIHSFRFQPNLINILANFFSNRKTILHVTGLGIAFANTGIKYRVFRFISQLIYQLKLFRATKLIFQNHDDIKDLWLSSFWKNKLEVIKGSGVNTDLYNPDLYNKELIRQNWQINQEEVVFICITRLLWEKGIKELCEAFSDLSNTNSNIKLYVVGWADKDNPRHIDSSYFDTLNGIKKIHFLGKREDIKELLSMSDVFIYPSYYREGIPRSILEALSMGKPIITTDTAGCNLTVIENSNGLLILPRSKETIKNSISQILKMDMKELGSISREMAIQFFSEKIIFTQIANIYQKI